MSKFVDKFCFSKQIFFAAILFITIFLFFIVAIKINSNQKTTITKAETVQPIIGGHPADPGEWPFMVYIQHNASFGISRVYCGGALISPKWIITARHCLTFDVEMKYKVSPYNLRVVLNLYKLSDKMFH